MIQLTMTMAGITFFVKMGQDSSLIFILRVSIDIVFVLGGMLYLGLPLFSLLYLLFL